MTLHLCGGGVAYNASLGTTLHVLWGRRGQVGRRARGCDLEISHTPAAVLYTEARALCGTSDVPLAGAPLTWSNMVKHGHAATL